MPIKQSPIIQKRVGTHFEDLEAEVYRPIITDISGNSQRKYTLMQVGGRMYAWNYRPFPTSDVIIRDITDWTEIAMFSLQGIYFPSTSVPLLCFDIHGVRESGSENGAKVRCVLVGENGADPDLGTGIDDQTIFEGAYGGTFNRLVKEVYLSDTYAGTGSMDQDVRQEWGWCLRLDVDLDGATTGIIIYKESSISLIYEF